MDIMDRLKGAGVARIGLVNKLPRAKTMDAPRSATSLRDRDAGEPPASQRMATLSVVGARGADRAIVLFAPGLTSRADDGAEGA